MRLIGKLKDTKDWYPVVGLTASTVQLNVGKPVFDCVNCLGKCYSPFYGIQEVMVKLKIGFFRIGPIKMGW